LPAYVRYPPSQPLGKLPRLVVDEIREGWRIHDEADPRAPRRWPKGKWRFDAPDGSWQVTYVNLTQVGAFAEVYAKRRDIGPAEADRRLSEVTSKPLRVIALDDPAVLASLRLDALVNVVPTYGRTMRWGERLREWYDGSNGELAHGIRYLGRRSASHLNYCLWLDRCPGLLQFSERGRLGTLRREVMLAADQLQLTTRLFDPATKSPSSAWPGR
jgi:hypothetical protein